jgi:hypothetical protein
VKRKKKKNVKVGLKMVRMVKKREVFSGTKEEAEIMDSEYNLFVVGTEKFKMITYLRECFYGKNATTGRIQRVHISS